MGHGNTVSIFVEGYTMEIKWTYIIIAVLYVLIFIIKAMIGELNKKYKEEMNAVEVRVFKKDFLTIVAVCAFVGMLIITILTTIGGMPFNINAFVIAILLVILSIISGFSKVLVIDQKAYVLMGEKIGEEDIKEIVVARSKVKIVTNKSVNYEFFASAKGKKHFKSIKKTEETIS